ncbi:hypothetical protein BD626DRAFT_528911 [Schizophyllum amplum]|uniref:Uncharacterized protein n=1 Tax=Schizophyllum amplum TaxID=97359 RepID=A0A550BS04_9AGAR|nr:hypothetical protein BD626DRAFT_528911 [Auriculariopsis ampla]
MSPGDPPTRAVTTDTTLRSAAFVPVIEQISTGEESSSQLELNNGNIDTNIARLSAHRGRQLVAELQLKRAAPVCWLPAELLSEIFIHLAQSDLRGYKSTKEGKDYAAHLIAVTVACVCVSWRVAALDTSRLWSRITVDEHTRHLEAYVCTCVLRSHEHGLEIDCMSAARLPAVLSHILPHAPRWESISFTGFFEDFCSIPPQHHFARLRKADLSIDSTIDSEAGAFDFLASAPMLRQVVVYVMESTNRQSIKLPSSWRLTSLHICLEGLHHIRPLVTALSQHQETLEDLICEFDDFLSSSPEDAVDSVHFPALGSLKLYDDAFSMLAYINAPNVREITLNNANTVDNPYTWLLIFTTLPSSPLTYLYSLHLVEVYHAFDEETGSELLHCLESMDNLQELEISCTSGSTLAFGPYDRLVAGLSFALWEGLTVREGERPLLPCLRSLELYLGTEILPDDARAAQRVSLTDMVRSRRKARVIEGREVVALKKIEVDEDLDI